MSISSYFSKISPKKALVIGDFFLDTYTFGTCSRISPEAPVAVVQASELDERPGGAGNVVLNLLSLGMEVRALGRVARDEAGNKVIKSLAEEGVDLSYFFKQDSYQTAVKNRVIASGQQIVRVDFETVQSISKSLEKEVMTSLDLALEGIEVIAVSDYGKGFLSNSLLESLMQKAKEKGIPVITDPKGIDFQKYAGTTLIKPNWSEAVTACGVPSNTSTEIVLKKILTYAGAEEVIVTQSEKGMCYYNNEGETHHFPVKIRGVKDVTGAGDTVLAVLSFAVANNLPRDVACKMANIAAGIAIEVIGCARVTLGQLADRLLEYDVENKVFTDEHLYALQEVLKKKHLTILGLAENTPISSSLFRTIRELGSREGDLLVYLKDNQPCEELLHVLTSLVDIQYLIHHGESLKKLCQKVNPSDVFVFSSGELKEIEEVAVLLN